MRPRTRSLFRLISMKKAGVINAAQWNAVKRLENHHAKHLGGPISTSIVNTSRFAALKTNMRISEIQEIYCAVCYQ